MVYSSKIQDY